MNSIGLNSPPPGHEFSVSIERVDTNVERCAICHCTGFCIADCVAMFPYPGFSRFIAISSTKQAPATAINFSGVQLIYTESSER